MIDEPISHESTKRSRHITIHTPGGTFDVSAEYTAAIVALPPVSVIELTYVATDDEGKSKYNLYFAAE